MMRLFKLSLLVIIVALSACGEDFTDDKNRAREEFEAYIKAAGIDDSCKLESGVYYIKRKDGTGAVPEYGDNVIFTYTVYLLDSTYDSSNREFSYIQPMPLFDETYLSSETIPAGIEGLHVGLSQMQEGEKATLIIPFEMAFEHVEVNGNPRFTSFRIEVELLDIQETIFE